MRQLQLATNNTLTLVADGIPMNVHRRKPQPAFANFDDFFRQEYPAMVAIARGVTGNSQYGEDLAQVAFKKAYENWDKVNQYNKPGAWVRRTTINLAISRKRKIIHEATGWAKLRDTHKHYIDPPQVEEPVWQMVGTLPAKQRAAVMLHYQDDLSTADIADIMCCSESTVRSHLHNARKTLANSLGENHDQ